MSLPTRPGEAHCRDRRQGAPEQKYTERCRVPLQRPHTLPPTRITERPIEIMIGYRRVMTTTPLAETRGFSVLKRAFTIAGLVVAGTVFPLVTAAPASATIAQCTGYLSDHGYKVGSKSTTACSYPHTVVFNQSVPNLQCTTLLRSLGVRPNHAFEACQWA